MILSLNFMQNKKPKILVISSANPLVGPGRSLLTRREAYNQEGIDADYLTLNPVEGYPDIRYVVEPRGKRSLRVRVRNYIKNHFVLNWRFFQPQGQHCFFYRWEEFPPVSNSELLAKLGDHYDLIQILFWQGMLSFSSIKALYKKYKCQVQFLSVDYSPMSGGCHFTCDCEKYKTGCYDCQGVLPLWANRFAHHNVMYRKRVYEQVKPIVFGNTFMHQYYEQSYLLKNVRYEKSSMTADLSVWCPQNKTAMRQKLGIDDKYSFILTFGCQSLNDPRKGMTYLLEALNKFYDQLTEEERESVFVLSMGRVTPDFEAQIPFDAKHLGFIEMSELPGVYSVADAFLCPSVYDAGPMMVNQSLCCGTPVIAFEMGAALDCVRDQGTGYCVPLMDSDAFADAIMKMYRQSAIEKQKMRDCALKFAQDHYSYKAKVKAMLDVYFKYQD